MVAHCTESRLIDTGLVGTFVASWVTHEAGALVHSVVSLVFTGFAVAHVGHNWSAYQASWKRGLRAASSNLGVWLSLVVVTVSGFTLWLADAPLGHGPLAIVSTVLIAPHLWTHRRSLIRVVGLRRSSRAPS